MKTIIRQLTQEAEAAIDAAVHDTRSCECWEQRAVALLHQRHVLLGMTCAEQRAAERRVRERISEDALEDALIDAHIAEQDRGGDICASCGADMTGDGTCRLVCDDCA